MKFHIIQWQSMDTIKAQAINNSQIFKDFDLLNVSRLIFAAPYNILITYSLSYLIEYVIALPSVFKLFVLIVQIQKSFAACLEIIKVCSCTRMKINLCVVLTCRVLAWCTPFQSSPLCSLRILNQFFFNL